MIGLFKKLFTGKQNISDSTITQSTVLQAGGDIVFNISDGQAAAEFVKLYQTSDDNELLNSLVKSRLDIFREMLLKVQIGNLSAELNKVFDKGIEKVHRDLQMQLNWRRSLPIVLSVIMDCGSI